MQRTALALAIGGAVAATVMTVTTVAVLVDPTPAAVDEPREATPTATTAPTTVSVPTPSTTPFQPVRGHDWLTAVPADVSVSAGLPEAGGDFERVTEAVTWIFCEVEAFPEIGVLDVRRDGATGPEYGDRRDLRVFPDDRAAHAFLARAATAARECPEERHGSTRWLHSVAPVDGVGDESVRILQTYESDGVTNLGATWWTLVRVGNAVLVTATGGEYLPGENLGQGIREHDRTLAPIVGSMCVFSAAGCDPQADIPDDFPLAAGWPRDDQVEPGGHYGRRGPNRSLDPLSWTLCDQSFTATGFTDRLRADWSNVEDFRSRELLTFADDDQAVAFASSFAAYWRRCDRYPSGDDYESVQDVLPTGIGGESWALISWSEYHGAPAVGLTVVHVIRLGRSVLIDTASNEGGAGPDREADITRQVDSQITATTAVVDAMCRFS